MRALLLLAGAFRAVEDQYKPWERAGYDANQAAR